MGGGGEALAIAQDGDCPAMRSSVFGLGLTGRSRPHPNPFRKREAQFKFPGRVRDTEGVPVSDLLSPFQRPLHLPRGAFVQAYMLPVCGIAAWNWMMTDVIFLLVS